MAISITKIDVATPTTFAATPAAGGSLADDTYYYRIASYRKYLGSYYMSYVFCYSAWSAEVSATTSGSNNTVALTWDAMANATGYIVQRSLVSGDYGDLKDKQTMVFSTRWGKETVGGVTTNSMSDTGGAQGAAAQWDGVNLDLDNEWPIIDISGASVADTVTLSAILDEDISQGWNLIELLGKSGVAATTVSGFRQNGFYFSKASLVFQTCHFGLYGPLYIFGQVYFKDCRLTASSTSGSRPMLLYTYPHNIDESDNGLTFARDNWATIGLDFDSSSTATDIFIEKIPYGDANLSAYQRDVNASLHEPFNNGTFTRAIMAKGTQSALPIKNGVFSNCWLTDCRLEGLSVLTDSLYQQTTGVYNDIERVQNTIFRRCKFDCLASSGKADFVMYYPSGSGIVLEDCTFHANSDGTYGTYDKYEPVVYIVRTKINDDRVYSHAYSFNLKVVDATGTGISGATVSITDTDGDGAIWVDSEATTTDTLTTSAVTTLTVSDGTKFSVDDVIRHECLDEIYLVTNIAGNDLTLTRGYLGTATRYLGYTSSVGARRILKQAATLTTDANGDIDSEPIFGRTLEHNYLDGGWPRDRESDLVTAGKLILTNHTPHTVTITATGYKTRTIKYTMDRKREEIEKLEKTIPVYLDPTNPKKLLVNVSPTNSQNNLVIEIN